eukprot:m.259326 g.259326  ORF g.259326 m.259326 type:complete len:558 (+) comp26635_c0_seq28:129-1802(+)
MAQLTLLPALHPRWCPGEGKPGGAGAMRVGYGCSPPLCPFSDARLPTARRDCKRDGWVVAGRVSGRHLAQQLLHSQHPCAENPQGGLGVLTDEELYVAPAVGGGYLNVDGAPGYEYEVPAREEKPRHGPAVSNPTFHPDGFDGFGGATSTDAYELIEAPAAPAVPVRRVESGAGSGGKEPKASTPRWMVVAVILALLLGVVAIAMGFLSGGSDSGGNTAPTTAPPTTAQVSATIGGPDINELATNLSLLQQVVQAQTAVVQEQSTNLSVFQQLVQDQAATIASLQSQLNTTAAPTIPPTLAPSRSPTTAPTRSPTTAPTRSPTTVPTRSPTHSPTPAPTDLPTTALTASTAAPSTVTHVSAVVASAQQLGLLMTNGTYTGTLLITDINVVNTLFARLVTEIHGDLSVQVFTGNQSPLTFPLLQSVSGAVILDSVARFPMFPALRVVNELQIRNNPQLATLNGSFPTLQTVHTFLSIRHNSALATLGTSFRVLARVGTRSNPTGELSLQVYNSAQFSCTTWAPRMCTTTSSWDNSGAGGLGGSARTCCSQFCASSPLC